MATSSSSSTPGNRPDAAPTPTRAAEPGAAPAAPAPAPPAPAPARAAPAVPARTGPSVPAVSSGRTGGSVAAGGRTRAVEKAQAWSAVASAVLSVVAIVLATLTFSDQSELNAQQKTRVRQAIAARVSVMEGLLPTKTEGELGQPGIVVRNRAPSPIFKVWIVVDHDGRKGVFYLDSVPPCVIIGLPKSHFSAGPVPSGRIVDLMWFTDDLGRGCSGARRGS